MQNGLQLSPDKSEGLIVGTSHQLRQSSPAVLSVTIAGVDLPVAEQMKVLSVVLDQRLRHRCGKVMLFYHIQAIRAW